MRTVIVASPAANKAKKIENFTGTTWGELKRHAIVQELMVGNVEAIVNPGNVTLSREDAELPAGDFKLYLVPTKNKAGVSADEASALGKEIADAIVNGSRLSSQRELTELKTELLSTVGKFYEVPLDAEGKTGNQELDATLQEASAMTA